MKALALLLVLTCQPYSRLTAQDPPNPKEPEEMNQFFFLDSTGEIRPLERQISEARALKGDRSEFRFVQGEPLTFVVKLSSQDVDPQKALQFVRLDVKGKATLFDAQAYGESSFKVTPKTVLGPGEYMLRVIASSGKYRFGVDPVKTDLK